MSVAYPWQRPYARAIFADPALMHIRLYEAMAAIRRRLRKPIKGTPREWPVEFRTHEPQSTNGLIDMLKSRHMKPYTLRCRNLQL
jgi:hypothetical protein